MKRFIIKTLGCKVNQYESDGIATQLGKHGYHKVDKGSLADLCIINTCSVTAKASMQSRQAIRKLIRDNPEAKIIVTGCHSQTEPEQIRSIEGVHHVIGNPDKTRIAHQITTNCFKELYPSQDESDAVLSICETDGYQSFEPAVFGDMTRAYLKIQDGCDAFCTYCIVPYARGKSTSMPESEVMTHLHTLNNSGFKEVILTGIHTGLYGLDLKPGSSITALLKQIIDNQPVDRVRLSSIEPKEITDELIRLMADHSMICNHLHIPLQSGDAGVLEAMGRPYDPAFFKKIIGKIHETIPGVCIGIDVMVGFPSEDEPAFQNTFELIKTLPLSYLHVFPYSPRKGTRAYEMKNQSTHQTIQDRCQVLRDLGALKKRNFLETQMGKPLNGLIQHKADVKTGRLIAITDNYISVILDQPDKNRLEQQEQLKGSIVTVTPNQVNMNLQVFGTAEETQ